jgi:hypothetical protein
MTSCSVRCSSRRSFSARSSSHRARTAPAVDVPIDLAMVRSGRYAEFLLFERQKYRGRMGCKLSVWTWRNAVAERLDPQGSVQPLLRNNNRPPRSEEDPDEDDDEAPETPLDEPAPTPVQDPPAEPDPHPYTVNL